MIAQFDTSGAAPAAQGGESKGNGAAWAIGLIVVGVIGYLIYREMNKPEPKPEPDEQAAQ